MSASFQDRINGITASQAYKAPVVAATTANITLSGAQTIDTVSVVADDRVLVKNQTDTTANGIYVASTGTWSRAEDCDGTGDLITGTMVFIVGGSTNLKKFYYCATANTVDIGTDTITWTLVP